MTTEQTSLSDSTIVVTAVSAVSAVGGNSETTAAAVKADVTPFFIHPRFTGIPHDPEWDDDLPIRVAGVPFIDPVIIGSERFDALFFPSLQELFSHSALLRSSLARTGFFLALPDEDSAFDMLDINGQWLTQTLVKSGLVGIKHKRMVRETNTGVFSLVPAAIEALQGGLLDQCIVAGLDSYLLLDRMALLDKQQRVKTDRNVDGFVPGEACAMFMLETLASARARNVTPLAYISGIGLGEEPNRFDSDRQSTGRGLSQAIRQAVDADTLNVPVSRIYSDLNGESYYSQEWGLMQSRLADFFNELKEFEHPSDCYGHVGAASGAVLAVCAALDFADEKTLQKTLITTAHDSGLRVALTLNNFV